LESKELEKKVKRRRTKSKEGDGGVGDPSVRHPK
jgi:hypothetical protein